MIGSERTERSETSADGEWSRLLKKTCKTERQSSINLLICGATICVSFRCNRIKERTHVRRCRMVALLRNSQRAINKTKPKKKAQPIKTKRRNQPEEERKSKKVGEAIIIIILLIIQKRIRCVTGGLLEFLSSDPVLAPIVKTPRGDGVCEEGPETRSWSNTQRKRRFFLLVLSVKMLQSCVQSIPSLTGCSRERRGAADVTGPRDASSGIA